MIKKYSKILITVLFAFLISLIIANPVNAKEITLTELTEMIKDYNPKATYAYVIGEYVFTSGGLLTTQDVMLAARSIEVTDIDGTTNKDKIYNEMTIAYYEGVFDSNWNLTGFKFVENIVGTTQPKTTFDIKHIDYNKEAAKIKIDVDDLVDEAYTTIENQADTNILEVSRGEGNNIKVTLKDLSIDSVDALMGTGVATAAQNFLKEEGIAGVTLKLGNEELPLSGTIDKVAVQNFLKKLGTNAGDLVDKTMTVTISFEEGYKTANSTEFTVTFGKVVNVNKLVNDAYETIKAKEAADKFVAELDGNTVEVKLMNLGMTSLETLAGTGIYGAIENFFDEAGIAEVVLTIGDVKLTVTDTIDEDAAIEFFKKLGNKSGDLVGKTITAEVALKDGFKALNDSNKFEITFKDATKVDVDDLVDEAYTTIENQADTNILEVSRGEGNNIKVTLKDLSIDSIDALMGTGVATAAGDFLKEDGIAGVTLKLGDEELPLSGTIDKVAVQNFLKKLGTNAGDLIGETMTVTISFEEGYKTANSTEFAVTFYNI